MTAFYKKTDNQLPFYQREYTDYIIVDDIDNMPWLAEEEMPWAINDGIPQVGVEEMPQAVRKRHHKLLMVTWLESSTMTPTSSFLKTLIW